MTSGDICLSATKTSVAPKSNVILGWIWARFLSLAHSKLRLCSASHRTGYFINLACAWISILWLYSEQETENRPWMVSRLPKSQPIPHCYPVCIWPSIDSSSTMGFSWSFQGYQPCDTQIRQGIGPIGDGCCWKAWTLSRQAPMAWPTAQQL